MPGTPPVPRPNRPDQVTFHANARYLTVEYTRQFYNNLIRYSQNKAFRQEDDEVLSNHVKNALDTLTNEPITKSRLKEAIIFSSSVILGVSAQNLVSEILKIYSKPVLPSPPTEINATAAIVYGVISFITLAVALIALLR